MTSDVIIGFAGDLGVAPTDVQSFYRDNWPRRIALSDDQFYHWQFIQTPVGNGHDSCVVALVGEEIAGVMGANDRPFNLTGQERNGAELTTWIVSERFRGRNIGASIVSFLQSKYDVLLGAGITAAALPLYYKAGFSYMKALPRLVRVYDLQSIASYCKIEKRGADILAQRTRMPAQPSFAYVENEVTSESIDCIYKEFARHVHLFCRKSEVWQWRYNAHPFFYYQTHMIHGADGKMLLVVRTDVLPNGAQVLRLIDMIGDANMVSGALDFLDRKCKDENIAVVDFFCTYAPFLSALRAAGWISVLDESFVQFPHLFSPVELREPATTSLILWSKDNMADMLDVARLYISKGDADLDRPTMMDIEAYGN